MNKKKARIIEKLLKGKPLVKREFDFLRDNPDEFKNIGFIRKRNCQL